MPNYEPSMMKNDSSIVHEVAGLLWFETVITYRKKNLQIIGFFLQRFKPSS
jgi:hypothetical protein